MDQKYLAEIKARCADVCNHGCTTDMMAVFSRYVKALYADNIVKDQQIATLKKALEYACADRATTPSMWQDLQKKYMEIAHQAQEQEGHDEKV